jgi:urease accessory protein
MIAAVLAHTGLPVSGALDGALHPLLGWDHLLAMVAVGVLAASVCNRRIALCTPLGFVGGMLIGGLAGMAGVNFGPVELAITASVIALGALVTTASRAHGWWLPLVAALFGAAHGHAHGAELPTGALPAAYVAGFILATLALHVAGATAGIALRRAPLARVATGALLATAAVPLLLTA